MSRAGALSWAAALHQLRGEVGNPERWRREFGTYHRGEHPLFRSHAIVLRGWALVEQGQCEEGIARLGEGLVAYRADRRRARMLALARASRRGIS